MPGPRERTYRGYLLRENPWLQLQGMQHVCVGRANKSRLRCARQLSDKRKFDPERRPAVIPIFGPYQSIVRFDNGARDGQPHAHAFRLARKPPRHAKTEAEHHRPLHLQTVQKDGASVVGHQIQFQGLEGSALQSKGNSTLNFPLRGAAS